MGPCSSPRSPPRRRSRRDDVAAGEDRAHRRPAAPAPAPTRSRSSSSWLSGELPQRQIGVGWAALRSAPPPADTPTLTVAEVDAAFSEIGALAGPGSQARRAALLDRPLRRGDRAGADLPAPPAGRRSAPGRAARRDGRRGRQGRRAAAADVRRAAMLGGDLPAVAAAALTGGPSALAGVPAAGRPAGRADAGADRHRRRRRAGAARW